MLPPRRCPTCHQLVTARRCPTCIRQRDTKRPTAAARGYCSDRWRRLRAAKLALEPVCSCGSPATQVDHIVPHHGPDHHSFWDQTNLQSLCASCHSRKTATTDSTFARKGVQR